MKKKQSKKAIKKPAKRLTKKSFSNSSKSSKSSKSLSVSSRSKNTHIEFKGFLSFLILHELSQKPLAGEDLAKKIGKRKDATLTPGTIYPALKKLKINKLIKFEKQGRRKVYTLTQKGKDDLEISYTLFSKYFFGLKNKIKRIFKNKRLKNENKNKKSLS